MLEQRRTYSAQHYADEPQVSVMNAYHVTYGWFITSIAARSPVEARREFKLQNPEIRKFQVRFNCKLGA